MEMERSKSLGKASAVRATIAKYRSRPHERDERAVAVIVSAMIFAGMHAAGGVAQVAGAFMFDLVVGWL